MKATNFDIRISKDAVIKLLERGLFDDNVQGCIMCKEYGDDLDWVAVVSDDLESLREKDCDWKTFEIWLK